MRRKWKQMWVSLLMLTMIALLVACGKNTPDDLQEDTSEDLQEADVSAIPVQQEIPPTDGDASTDSIAEQTNPVSLYKTISKYSSDGTLQETIECTYDDSDLTLSCDVVENGEKYIFSYDVFGRAIDGKVFNSNEVLIEWESFGKDGNEMIYMDYNDDGTIYMGYQYQYDESGNKIKSIIYASDGSYELEDYDENGNMISTICYESDGSVESSVLYDYEYDANGNNIKQTTYGTDGVVSYWYEYEYDGNGNKVRGSKYGKYIGEDFPILTYTYTWEYDSEGNMLRYVEYRQDGSITFEQEYDSMGRFVKELYYADDGSFLSGYENKFDTYGRVIQILDYDNGVNSFERIYDYGTNGKVVLMKLKNAVDGRESYRIEYEYDTKGNMLRSSAYDSRGNAVIVDYQTILFNYDEEKLQPRNLVLYHELDAFDVPADISDYD